MDTLSGYLDPNLREAGRDGHVSGGRERGQRRLDGGVRDWCHRAQLDVCGVSYIAPSVYGGCANLD